MGKHPKLIKECWPWKGKINKAGYGYIQLYGKRMLAHRFVYILFYGQIPKGKVIHHLCFNKWCVNILHLRPVTSSEHTRIHKRRMKREITIVGDK